MSREMPGILLASYGCGRDEGRRTLERMESDIRAAYPGHIVGRAWTSERLRERFRKEGVWIPGVKEALLALSEKGVRRVAIQSTHILDGLESRKMREEIKAVEERFLRISMGEPLLSSAEDKRVLVRVIAEETKLEDGQALLLVGHGTKSSGDAVYAKLENLFREGGYRNMFLGSMEGERDVRELSCRIAESGVRRVLLAPFMITAGKHAARDLCGEGENSWRGKLLAAGFSVECRLKGLGEYEGIRKIVLEHVADSMKKCLDTKEP